MCFAESIPECDVEQWNKDFMERSEEVYDALMSSHWEPLDSVDSPIPSMSWWLFLHHSVSFVVLSVTRSPSNQHLHVFHSHLIGNWSEMWMKLQSSVSWGAGPGTETRFVTSHHRITNVPPSRDWKWSRTVKVCLTCHWRDFSNWDVYIRNTL